jgi:hypothetical protein
MASRFFQSDLSQAKLPTTRRNPAEAETVPPKFKHELQFDLETGSLLSGIYEPERSPVLLQSPLGLSIIAGSISNC